MPFVRRKLQEERWRKYVEAEEPVPFKHRGRTYYLNPDGATIYHIQESVQKNQRMVDVIGMIPGVVFDVGGNCGLFSAFVENRFPDAEIYCFEPSEDLIELIEINCSEAVTICPFALAEHDGRRTLYVNLKSQQTNSLDRNVVELTARDGDIEQRKVLCRSIESYAEEKGIEKIDVLKIDVQGLEGAVLRGAHKILPTVKLLFIESTWMEAESIFSVFPFAKEYGFTHIGVINPVYLGADVVLSRHPLQGARQIVRSFEVNDDLLAQRWT